MDLLGLIIIVNGIYDIICAISMLWLYNVWGFRNLALLHSNVIHVNMDLNSKRLLAYWIFTYGMIRIIGSPTLVCFSYVCEAFVFEYELVAGSNSHHWKTRFISVSSIALAIAVYITFGDVS
jgi:hypothetical protein